MKHLNSSLEQNMETENLLIIEARTEIFILRKENNIHHTCDHLYTNPQVKCSLDRLSTVMSRRIKQGQQATKCPWPSSTVN